MIVKDNIADNEFTQLFEDYSSVSLASNLDNNSSNHAATSTAAQQHRTSPFTMSPLLTLNQKESGNTKDYINDIVSSSVYPPPAQDPQRVLRQMMNLCKHIYSRGLIEGSGSDVTIQAFDKNYHLHRIILYQNSYFSVLLEGPWKESGQKDIELRFDDENITRDAFEIALGRLYGRLDEIISPSQVLNLLATASFLDLQDLCEMCVEVILRDIKEDTVVHYLNFATSHFYGTHSEKITESCFTYLCREGFDNIRLRPAFLKLPAEWLKRVIESDAFWVPSEYERYIFARDVVSQRRKIIAEQKRHTLVSSSLVNDTDLSLEVSLPTSPTSPTSSTIPNSTHKAKRLQDSTFSYHTRRSSSISTFNSICSSNSYQTESDESIYKAIFTYAIYYAHMAFEELTTILYDCDETTSAPFAPDYILKEALWQQIDLRNKIENAAENDITLGISSSEVPPSSTGVHFEIPSDDTTHIGEALTGLEDMIGGGTKAMKDGEGRGNVEYSLFAPFRFSVEFADVAKLKEKQRVYSGTKFYAGSNWNMYIQKIKTPRKGIQLGVYLHRHSMPDPNSSGNTSSPSTMMNGSPTNKPRSSSPGTEERYATAARSTIHMKSNNEKSFSKYADKRKTVRTWFKIFCPARGPSHVLTQFQSSPDNFALMQSWGWRSSSLCQDDYLLDVRDFDNSSTSISTNSSTLKFSVVMGHV
ncbi:9085_t:CDS:2 [Funneliformis geosporum]|uniref:3631_t:CDS:1 n=1 Tax=Funneliformis geosporum TaxID=1117311 RepID=A0A9W4WPC9_9GLOM|nr:9085_t:CDS:2 [Funneliformis geosporum]CAI2168936.1 3631_t:CDS:2 [Funneliformis geosporum]